MINENYAQIIADRSMESTDVILNAIGSIPSRVFENHFKNMSETWGILSDKSKAEIASSIAGTYNISRFLHLMNGLTEIKNVDL
jgi:hypothetical protein